MNDKPVYVTSKGLNDLKEELAHLENEKRPETLALLQDAKEGGDWMDNTEGMLFEEDLAFIDGRIRELTYMIKHAQLIEPGTDEDTVEMGETVTVQHDDGTVETYTIVGPSETDPAKGFISNESPLGKALLNHDIGEQVVVKAPIGDIRYLILDIKQRTS